jgi:DNA repair exonuclease SbcCD ATPase subunit
MANKSTSSADDRGLQGAAGKRQWRVRTEKGDTFGPADLATLKAWAQDGRLAPTHQISDDGQTWGAVTSMPELEMDWVAEVTPGSFYGPIHKDAMAELLREGSISAAAPRFQRALPSVHTPSEHEQQLETRVRDLQQQLSNRVAELESQLAAARGEQEQTRSALGARDLEFDAERQEQKASLARLQAELLKRDGRIAALETDAQRLEQLSRERQALETRLSDAERLAAEHDRQAAQQREALEQSRNLQREAERTAALLQERMAGHARDTESLRESVRSLQLRLGSVRKLLQQANASLGGVDEATDAEIIVEPPTPPSGIAKDGPPPLATPAGGVKPGMSLADLEAQAQRELRQLGHKGGALFKGRAKGS